MPKQRDYRAEYKRRIQSGLARGYTRSQSSGHPSRGEKHLSAAEFNPFKDISNSIREFVSEIQNIFPGEPSGFFGGYTEPNDIEYFETTGEWGINTLPRWSIGSNSNPADLDDFRRLFSEVRDKRYQNSYTMVVCGYLEDLYPGHDADEPIECLSYRIRIPTIRSALSQNPRDLTEFINMTLPEEHVENWLIVNEVQFIDKE